jgi:hypothetical protein
MFNVSISGSVLMRLTLLAAVFVVLSACGGGDSTAPKASIAGTWTAPTAGQFFNNVHVQIILDANGSVEGGWSMDIANCAGCSTAGLVVGGSRTGSQVVIPFTRQTSCVETTGIVTATLTSPNMLTGNFVRTVCGGPNDPPAQIVLTKQ